MKRDMDLIRELLRRFEADERQPTIDGRTPEELAFHVHLLAEAGLVIGGAHKKHAPGREWYSSFWFSEITWAGYDFLAASRNDTRWNKLRDTMSRCGESLTLDLTKRLLERMIEATVLPIIGG